MNIHKVDYHMYVYICMKREQEHLRKILRALRTFEACRVEPPVAPATLEAFHHKRGRGPVKHPGARKPRHTVFSFHGQFE